MSALVNRCDRCGEIVSDIDAGFSPGVHEMAHGCGGTWRQVDMRGVYLARFGTQVEAVKFEERVLSIGSEFLPAFAVAVRDGAEPTAEYWEWLIAQHQAVTSEGDS